MDQSAWERLEVACHLVVEEDEVLQEVEEAVEEAAGLHQEGVVVVVVEHSQEWAVPLVAEVPMVAVPLAVAVEEKAGPAEPAST